MAKRRRREYLQLLDAAKVAFEVGVDAFNCVWHPHRQGPPRRAFLAARTLADALRSPMGILGLRVPLEVSEDWRNEHNSTLDRLGQLLTRVHAHPVVLVRAAESVAWHAFHDHENAGGAQLVLSLLERDLETRLIRALMDEWGTNNTRRAVS